jgi:hypothetical protein
MTLGFTILIITYDNYIILKVTLLAEDQQNLNLYRDFIRPHICWRGCESTNLGMQMLGQFCLASTFQVPVKVPACVSWAFIATSCTEVRHIYIYTHIYACYMQHFFSQQEPPLWCSWSSFVCSSWDARRDYPFHHICSKSCNETLAETCWWWYSEELDRMSSPVSIVTMLQANYVWNIPFGPRLTRFPG